MDAKWTNTTPIYTCTRRHALTRHHLPSPNTHTDPEAPANRTQRVVVSGGPSERGKRGGRERLLMQTSVHVRTVLPAQEEGQRTRNHLEGPPINPLALDLIPETCNNCTAVPPWGVGRTMLWMWTIYNMLWAE
jgi:hypothetical protein